MIRVVGAGIVGLAVADELVRRGHPVEVVDPAPGSGASHAAAGMLSPAGEAWHGEEELFRLGATALEMWPAFAARLGVPVHRAGTLLVGADAGDVQDLERQLAVLDLAGVAYERLTRRELVAREPGLGRVVGGALLLDDHSVDPRAVVAALLQRLGDRVVRAECVGLDPSSLVPHDDGSTNRAGRGSTSGADDVTVVATGAWLPEPYAPLVRPVRGDILRVRTDDPPSHTVRAWVRGETVYIVPRESLGGAAEVVVGATSEERTGPPEPTAESVWRLLDAARRVVPGLDRAVFVEAIARDRPGTPDNHPLIGPTGQQGVVLAAGTYRNGVLLAPLVAQLVADHIETGSVDPAADPRRFTDRFTS